MTTVRSFTQPSIGLPVGGAWAFLVETRDALGYRSTVVTPTLSITTPAGAVVPVVLDSVDNAGLWSASYAVATSGRYVAAVSTPEDTVALAAYAYAATPSSGMPTVDTVGKYLGNRAGNWTTVDLQDALDAEASAQRDVCVVPAAYPDSLRQALLRRVQRNLAMRSLPLAVQTGDADGGTLVLPGRDPVVRQYEGPHLRRSVG